MALDFVKEMVEARRCLHKRPEEGWTEFETTWFIVRRLKALGLQVTIGKANICESEVLGRDPVLVSDAMKRAAAHGVPANADVLGHFLIAVAAAVEPSPQLPVRNLLESAANG